MRTFKKKKTQPGAHPPQFQGNWPGVQPGYQSYFKALQVVLMCSSAGILFKEEEAMNRDHHDNLLMHGQPPDRTQVCPKRSSRELSHQDRIPRGFTLLITGVLGRFQGHSAQKNHLAQGFSTLALDFAVLGQIMPCGGCHPVHGRRFRSVPGLHPLDARKMPHCQSYTPKCLWDTKLPPVENQ